MGGPTRIVPVLVGWALLALAGCTTSFELRTRPADAGADAAPDLGADLGVPEDVPEIDAPPSCREPGDRCCAEPARGAFCTAGLVCSEGYCARCPGALFACGNACVDLQTNGRHCGACGSACGDGQRCASGSCVADCPAAAAACGGRCVNLQSDAEHCGRCGNSCATAVANTGSRCRNGACQTTCEPGFDNCDGNTANGCEVDLRTTAAHCGACGQACAPNRATGRCEAGVCGVGACNPGYADCDGNAANGCEVDVARDSSHCGRCLMACSGGRVCMAGACVVPSMLCPAGTADCMPGTNVCETSTATDLVNCGACGRTCAFANAQARCAGGACSLGNCLPGFLDCDALASTGCERRIASDVMNCGACGNACAAPHGTPVCRAGACAVDACDPGYLDCDGNPANGCEVDSRTHAGHCGGCGLACSAPHVNAACIGGRCEIVSCAAGYADCDDRASNGCEVDLNADPVNCGRCTNLCAFNNAAASCAAGSCTLGACAAGFGNCDGVAANGCEADTRTNAAHCGGCGRACSLPHATAVCAAGACAVSACAAGYADCDGMPANGCEVDVRSDSANCGECRENCRTGYICANGACVLSCPTGQAVCNGACVDLATSNTHCGACGAPCAAGANQAASCQGGVCQRQCTERYADCDGSAANGCEVNLRTDRSNCGACGLGCVAPANAESVCAAGVCGFACRSGYESCDGVPSNGCEAALQTDRNNCGRCGVACLPALSERYHTATSLCVSGDCQFTCQQHWADCNGDPGDGCEQSLLDQWNCGACGRMCGRPVVGAMSNACCAAGSTGYRCCSARQIINVCANQTSATCTDPQ